jgi:pimeloyl-ACP methyl ester carboxylesterase
LEVAEDRTAATGRRIRIHVAVLPPLRRSAAPDPLFIFAGGPGQGARSAAALMARALKAVRRTRAIALVDLRGTGASAPLECLERRDDLDAIGDGRHLFLRMGEACAAELTADPRHYTHRNALADFDDVRRALGYSSINVWGGSWGTRAALIYALGYPHAVRRVVLDGAVALDMQFPRTVAASAERSFELLAGRCAADPRCARAFPHPRAELDKLLDRLERAPASVSIRHPRTGLPKTVTLTRDVAAEILRVMLYTTVDATRIFSVVRSARDSDFAPLTAQYLHSASLATDDMALGSTMAILCSEDLPLVQSVDFAAEARGTFLRESYAAGWVERCRAWATGPAVEVASAASSAPALILSGAADPVTPPSSGEAMGRWFPGHEHIVVPGAAHNASFTGCVPDLIAAFLDAHPIDASCVGDVPLPPVVVGPAGGRP